MGRAFSGALALATALSGCCFFPAPDGDGDEAAEPTATSAIEIEEVVFARGVTEQFELEGGAVETFRADETAVHARITIDGRPRAGQLTMRWMWDDTQIAEATVDLSDVNGGLLFSVGQDTYVRGTLSLERMLYIGDGHRLVLLAEGEELGSWGFDVVPPEGARPSRFVAAQLYRSFDPQTGPSDPATTFAPGDTVFVVGQVALGYLSWFDAEYTVSQQVDAEMTQEMIGPEDGGEPTNFVFRGQREGGWPEGSHRVTLILDDRPVSSLPFTVAAAP